MADCIDSIFNLRKIVPDPNSPSQCVMVKGYFEPGDGGGGLFFWDSLSKEEDLGIIVKPNTLDASQSGRWRRIFDGPISVKWFGAKGDFDPESGNGGNYDTDAIKAAFKVSKRTGIPLYLPPGKYKITSALEFHSSNLDADGNIDLKVPYHKSQQGLHFFGAGMQKSILYNEINDPNKKPSGGPTISITRDPTDTRTFQQTGLIRDLKITSKNMYDGGVGIEIQAAWGYTLERVRIRDMGSDGLILRNQFWNGVTSDFDACAYTHLDHVISEANRGWGIIVSTAAYNVSTAFTHIERCIIDENKGGGIQWTGQQGLIERCGIHANGVYPIDPAAGRLIPTPVPGTNGLLIRNVHAPSFGLHIDGCEFQGNSQTQVSVEYGSNIKITQNMFSADDLDKRFSFPEIDIQIGDANLGDIDIDFSTAIKSELTLSGTTERVLTSEESNSHILDIQGKLTTPVNLFFPLIEEKKWLVVNNADNIVYLSDKVSPHIALRPNTEKVIATIMDEGNLHLRELPPRLVNGCVIEDNRIRAGWNTKKLIKVSSPDGSTRMVPAGWGDIGSVMPRHTVVKVNSNAVGTIIRNWWIFSLPEDDQHKLVEMIECDPYTHQRLPISPFLYSGKTHVNTNLLRGGIDGGSVLHPFAYHQPAPFVNQIETYTPDTSRWSYFRFRIDGNGNTSLIKIENPTTRTIGTPLFLEFVNGRREYVTIKFGTEYRAGESLGIQPGKTISAILLFDIAGTWTSFSPWTCDGKPI